MGCVAKVYCTKRIVCLANSRKLTGRSIVGVEWDGECAGGWCRPISDREHGEVSEYERQYEDGSDPKLLDIIDVPLIRLRAEDFQTENWLLDPERYWDKAGEYPATRLGRLADPESALWIDGFSTYDGLNDKIPADSLAELSSSLRLIHVDAVELHVYKPGEAFGNRKRRVQAHFAHWGINYRLWVTDPVYERRYLAKLDGTYPLAQCFLTVSLGEPYGGACYKLVAAIIEPLRWPGP